MSETVKIRELMDGDAARCAELEAELFPGDDPWSVGVFRAEFALPYTIFVGAVTSGDGETEEDFGKLVGYGGIAMMGTPTDPEFEVHTIGVDPAWQRRGIGRALLTELLQLPDAADAEVFLEVRTDNEPAIRMYESFGFARQGLRKNYYRPSGADAYTMCRPRISVLDPLD